MMHANTEEEAMRQLDEFLTELAAVGHDAFAYNFEDDDEEGGDA